MNKKWLIWPAVAGAILTPLLLLAHLFASSTALLNGLPSDASPISIVSVPFIEFTSTSGRTIRVPPEWLCGMAALFGGLSFAVVAGIIRALLIVVRR